MTLPEKSPIKIAVENGSDATPETKPLDDSETENKLETSMEKQEPALETLAKNLEQMGKFKVMQNDIKETDMIAFKIFTPNFEKSEYVIGLIESIIGKNTPEQQDYDLALLIMGKHMKITFCHMSSS